MRPALRRGQREGGVHRRDGGGALPDDEIVARVRKRAAELGKPIGQVLDEAGLDPHYLLRRAQKGRRLDALEALAGALGWDLGELVSPRAAAASWLADASALNALLAIAVQRHGMTELCRMVELAAAAAKEIAPGSDPAGSDPPGADPPGADPGGADPAGAGRGAGRRAAPPTSRER